MKDDQNLLDLVNLYDLGETKTLVVEEHTDHFDDWHVDHGDSPC
jgi:hypothetical protein